MDDSFAFPSPAMPGDLCGSPSVADQIFSMLADVPFVFTAGAEDDDDELLPLPAAAAVPKPVVPGAPTLVDRMFAALSLFKESSGNGILAQVWMPVAHGDSVVLSTSEQPFLYDQILAGYREVSRKFVFPAKDTPGLSRGLPGRVFISGVPEWTPDVAYYSRPEYLRIDFAKSHDIRGSLAMPVFDGEQSSSCCAVFELVTKKEKPHFDAEMDSVCSALQAVRLNTVKWPASDRRRGLSESQQAAFNEILDVLRAICHAHMLPLALTWVPHGAMLCVEESASYVGDASMKGFLHACAEHPVAKGLGIAGRALESNHPFFIADVREYDIGEYPLAHHARRFGLRAAVAIRLRSIYTGSDDYVLEFFLPVSCTGGDEQQRLLNNLSGMMQRINRSLRTVADTEVNGEDAAAAAGDDDDQSPQPAKRGGEKRRAASAEKNISLSVLRSYFSGSLKDAARSLGVCPTTLKRICRHHGILRWPSRKIKKVNRSLEKIQHVIDSVEGVDGALEYDLANGCLVASVSVPGKTIFTAGHKPAAAPAPEQPACNVNMNSPPSCSTDSSSGSASLKQAAAECEAVTVKATYKGDTARFKLAPSAGWRHLQSEVAKRFRLPASALQLKYMDDEEEWVILANDADLCECVDILETAGSRILKLQVRDLPRAAGSSGSSSCVLAEAPRFCT